MPADRPFLPPVDGRGNAVDGNGVFIPVANYETNGSGTLGVYYPQSGPPVRGVLFEDRYNPDGSMIPSHIILGGRLINDPNFWMRYEQDTRGTVEVQDSEPAPPPPPPPPPPVPEIPPAAFAFYSNSSSGGYNSASFVAARFDNSSLDFDFYG